MQENKIGFWGTNGEFGCFSNFYPCEFKCFDGKTFSCSEQAFMYAKAKYFCDYEIAEKIMQETDPYKIKKLGRKVKNFDEYLWSTARYQMMKVANYNKFFQNEKIKRILIDTGDCYLYENSPFDYVWGVGKNGSGQNLLGKVLMEVREEFQKENN
jgi:hypothetical protein